LGLLAVGLERFRPTLEEELARVAAGRGAFKAIRGEYGSGKTFCVRWIQELARQKQFVTAEVQISENETPLYKLNTVYRRVIERLSTQEQAGNALKSILDLWLPALEADVEAEDGGPIQDPQRLHARVHELMRRRLDKVSEAAPMFAQALLGYHELLHAGERDLALGVLAWLSGQPNVAAEAKRRVGVKGEIDHDGALAFLRGLLVVLRDCGHPGLVLVLDEVETLQRMRTDVRDKSLNALRQWIDELTSDLFPGLYLVLTGTPAFFDGQNGVRRLEPLHQRIQTSFKGPAEFDNPRAPQLRLTGFDLEKLFELGQKVRDVFASGSEAAGRVLGRVDDAFLRSLARGIVGDLGGKVGIAPRLFLRKLVVEVLDKVELYESFDPRQHADVALADEELTREERALSGRGALEALELDLGEGDGEG
jgi:hypothetical protein